MKKMISFCRTLLMMLSISLSVQAQYQFPDSGFEDWSGATFDNKIQPKYWNFSNVEQLGVKRNFAHQETGRSGHCLKIQDQFVGVGAIGATSPGYVALGHPWAYVSSLTSIDDATAGTHGGIDWSHRPDSMVVWIKRIYDGSVDQAAGDHLAQENFHLLYYAWTGTSKGQAYLAKDGGCNTQVANKRPEFATNEESDIRQALNGNVCGTATYATQIAEGWYYEKARYDSWTKITVPIYYMNDQVPTMCNVILSAGRYPEFRANNGQYAGSTLLVDDISLKYSSKIQALYVGGREWKNFDPNNTGVQTYSLGRGATTIPSIEAMRGIGKLTNGVGTTAKFNGRKLTAQECTINTAGAAVDGAPVTITVRAEDGSSTTTYQIQFVSQQSSNAYLASILVNDEPLSGFNPYVTTYNVALPYGTTTAPVLTAEAQDGASFQITQATSVNGTATIQTTAQDGVTKQTYTLRFSVAQLSDNTLKDILINGTSLPGFVSTKTSYNVSLPLDTETAPSVTPVSAYPAGAQTITVVKNSLEEGCQITVSAPGAATTRTYKLNYKIEASSYAYLAGIALDGVALEGFDPQTTSYAITLPMGTTTLPAITWTTGDPYQQVTKTEGGVEGTTRLTVTAAAGNTQTYRLNFSTLKSSNSLLAGIALNGEALEGFDSAITDYTITLPAGTKTVPTITWVEGDAYQTVRLITAGLSTPARLIVTAGDGSTTTYLLTFTVEKSASALLQNILLGGVALEGFLPETFDYRVRLLTPTTPRITVVKGDGQQVTIAQPQSTGVATITVQPEEGEPNTYTITFFDDNEVIIPSPVTPTYTPSSNANLQMIYLNGTALEGFNPATTEYTIPLAMGTTEQPLLTAEAQDSKVRLIVYTQGEANANATIRVLAEDSVTEKEYLLHFPLPKSSNTTPEDIDAGGFITFNPAQTEYSFELPFGTPFPDIFVTKAEETQGVKMEYLNCKTRRDIEIEMTAEDGSTAIYRIHITIPTHPNNVLKGILGNGFALDSMTLNSTDTVVCVLPVGTETFAITSFLKNYDDQYVIVRDGGLNRETNIWVYSGYPGEEAKIYTLRPKVQDPYVLTNLTVDGATIAGFSPERYDYILPISGTKPVITATTVAESTLDELSNDTKHYQVAVEYGNVAIHTYTVWFYYTNDVIPNGNFAETATATYNNAFKPRYWQVPADGDDKYSWALQGEVKTGPEVTRNSDGSIRLETWRSKAANSIYGSLPGMMTLGTITLDMASTGNSTSSVSGGIDFHNTPDTLLVDARPVSKKVFTGIGAKDMPHWRVLTTMDGQESLYEGDFSTLNSWRTVHLPLSHGEMVSSMNIVLNSGKSEDAKDYGGYDCYTSQVDFRNARFAYSSVLNGIIYNGTTIASNSSRHFDITLPTEFNSIPSIDFVYAVTDQASAITWGNEVAGVRTATIRNYAEDGSYTDYTLTATRPLSTDAGYSLVDDSESSLAEFCFRTNSVHANATVEMAADSLILIITPESGAPVRHAFSAFVHDTIRTILPGTPTPAGKDSVLSSSQETDYSSNLDLQYILLGSDTLRSYSPYTLEYTAYTPSTVAITGVPSDDEQTITLESHTALSDGSDIYYIHVRAGNGETRVYTLRIQHSLPATDASLAAIALDGNALDGFAPTTYAYTIPLPAHSELPEIEVVPRDDKASVTTSRSGNDITLIVTAENGVTEQTYTLQFVIAASDVSTLNGILLAGAPLTTFDAATLNYEVTLPTGTTTLPEIGYIPAEPAQTVSIDTVALSNGEGTYRLTVTAEDGVHQTIYTLHFTVNKSNNAHLAALLLDGTPMGDFDPEDLSYTVHLPYGTASLPVVSYTKAEEAQTVVAQTADLTVTLTVTAEDGTTTLTYTVLFDYLPSTNALLDMIFLDGDSLPDFHAENFEYTISLPYGQTTHPVLTWTAGDNEQSVSLLTGENDTIRVTAGNGDTNEYVLSYVNALSDNNYLADLQLRGTTVAGFHRDSTIFLLTYPVGTTEEELYRLADMVAIPEDPAATVQLSEDGQHTLNVLVTAQNGDIRPYVVRQLILLSDDARLKMIYLDSVALSGFDPDTLEYTYTLAQGTTAPELTAIAMAEQADVEYGQLLEEEGGWYMEVDGVAEDGSRLTYTVHFRVANWVASPMVTTEDYLFFYAGDGCYKAVTIGLNVTVNIYDTDGHMLATGAVPTASPNDVTVEVHEDGSRKLVKASPSADGYIFYEAKPGTIYFYTFFNAANKRVAKGGKICYIQ